MHCVMYWLGSIGGGGIICVVELIPRSKVGLHISVGGRDISTKTPHTPR